MDERKIKFIKELSYSKQKEILDFILEKFDLQKNEETYNFYKTLIEYIKTVRRDVETFKKNVVQIIDLFFNCGYDNEQIISILTKEPSLLHANKNDIFWRILLLGKVIDRKNNLSVREKYLVQNPRVLRISQDLIYSRIKYLESEEGKQHLKNKEGLSLRQITKITNEEFRVSYGIDKESLLNLYPFNNEAQLEVVSWKENYKILNDVYQRGII